MASRKSRKWGGALGASSKAQGNPFSRTPRAAVVRLSPRLFLCFPHRRRWGAAERSAETEADFSICFCLSLIFYVFFNFFLGFHYFVFFFFYIFREARPPPDGKTWTIESMAGRFAILKIVKNTSVRGLWNSRARQTGLVGSHHRWRTGVLSNKKKKFRDVCMIFR